MWHNLIYLAIESSLPEAVTVVFEGCEYWVLGTEVYRCVGAGLDEGSVVLVIG